MLITLQIEHVIPDIHVVFVVIAHGMEILIKSLASKGFFLFQSVRVMTLRI